VVPAHSSVFSIWSVNLEVSPILANGLYFQFVKEFWCSQNVCFSPILLMILFLTCTNVCSLCKFFTNAHKYDLQILISQWIAQHWFWPNEQCFRRQSILFLFLGVRIQLIEFLVADYLLEWSKAEDFDTSMNHPPPQFLLLFYVNS
jgi:hypothetical protein